MGDLNKDDDYIHRLGKLVPVYVVAFVASIEGFLTVLTDVLFQIAGLGLVSLIAVAAVYIMEFRNQNLTIQNQKIVLVISTLIYLGLLWQKTLLPLDIQFNALVAIAIMGYTLLVPMAMREGTVKENTG
ncbi:MAG: hypothetical protein ACFFFG_14305 [Candidatus Thorarchaeota archaeon]